MMKIKLPRGIKYRVEPSQPGIVIPGSENEPIITLFGRGSMIQCKLVSCAMEQEYIVQDTYSTGSLDDDEIEMVHSWVEHLIPSLLQEAGIRHFIRFLPDSKCYYDFASQTLYGANGYKEKKGKRDGNRENTALINGEPCKLKKSERAFIEWLTRTPNAQFSMEAVEDWSGLHGAGSVTSTWHEFKRHDSSIDATFDRNNGMFFYRGVPQIWVIGEENAENELTLGRIFDIVGYGDIVAVFDKIERKLRACRVGDVTPEESLVFLGVDNTLMDLSMIEIDIERFVSENYCPVAVLNKLLSRYSASLEAVWKVLRDNISENLSLSLNASTYRYETEEIPARLADLKGYAVTTERLEKSLQRICPSIKDIITSSCVGTDYFGYCDITVKPSSVVDYIVALILICFSYCQSEKDDEKTSIIKTRYQNALRELIHKRFNYSPPGDGKDSIIEEIQRLLVEIQSETRDAGLDSSVSKITKINDLLNLLGYNDSNSLLPPSMGREL